ncbi:MAG TPA: Ig-like domain-containing protein [Allosphingosinicella sp.]|jgi:VCBS repeat-containing protein
MSWDEIIKGGNGSDIINGGSGDDFIQGRAGGDFLDGGAGNDSIQGNEGDDYIRGGAGNDFIHGGTGTDTAVYSGSIKDYSYRRNGEEFFLTHVGGSMIDGEDRLISIERLVFADAVIDLTQNNAPIAFNDAGSTDEDSSVSGNVLANDFDWEGNAISATPGTFNGVYGTLTLNANGSYTYTPYASTQSLALGQNVIDSFTYTVSDGSLSDTGTLTITVAGRNDAPVANPDAASTGENSPVSVNVLANDSDVDNGAVLTVIAASAPAGQGSVSVVANQIVFDPGTDFDHLDDGESANVVVSYTISDEHGATSSSTVTITVNGANDAPVANDDASSTSEDAAVAGNVLANDSDVDGETLTVSNPGVYVGAYGALTLAADGSYTYAPNAAAQGLDDGESAQDVFAYTASDGTASDSASLTITVNGANDAPVANGDAASASEDGSVSGNVLGNDTDADIEALTVTNPGVYVGAYGTLTLAADGSYTYAPNAAAQGLDDGESAQDVFAYTASDGTASDSASLTITVNGANDAPVANDDAAFASEDGSASGNVLANDIDADVEALTVTNPGVYVGAYGTLTLAADGSYTYAPNAAAQGLDDGESAQDAFTYTASDGTASDSAILTITVNGANDAPVANDDAASASEDGGASGNVLANDTDADVEALTVANPGIYVGAYGTLTLAADGSYSYTPNAAMQGLDDGETAQDVFTYTASDGTASDSAALTITVTGANDAPVANDDAASTSEDGSVSGNVLANDTDADIEALTVTNPGTYVGAYGTLTLAADGSYTYTPNAAAQGLDDGESAQDVFAYTALDGTASDSGVLTVTVSGSNDAPVANDDSASAGEDSPGVSGNVLANDSDPDVETLTVTNPGTYVGAYGTLTLAADGSYTYTPNAAAQGLDDGEMGQDVFAYTASDGTASDSASLTITVTGANDAPVANDDAASASEDGTASGNVLVNDTDPDGEALSVTSPGTYAGNFGTLTLAADGSYTYTPNAAAQGLDDGETGQDVFAYTASDGTASDSATLTVTVSGANDAPVANDDSVATDEDNPVSGNVLANDTDVDGEALTVTNPGTYAGTYGTLTLAADGSYTYTPNAAAQALNAGDSVEDVFTYTASDGTDSDSATLTVTVNGADEGPQTVWYIDNSAVGSTNVGTQANPFTSIAAFNAAQGGVDGPQEGATVYLLQGTGTYAEADGINLLDDQILIGVGQPTIAPAAGNGIDLGDNNNVSGVDIAVGAGHVGIEDDGSGVGNLTVTDVAISGAGQIVDLDTGGTLDVTLNSAASTGSSGGAIDLAGVGGSFTVTGATTIAGAHSGGGIDITGSSVAASFAGGGTVVTGAATAVNYAGNSGSLHIGGGLDIVTTSGAGLNASGGGAVSATGSGNSIVSTSGTALSVSGTSIGLAGLTFESISSTGAVSGIVLNNTGTTAGVHGGLIVTGDSGSAANGSGGTIAGSTGAGISLTATRDVNLDQMNVQNGGNDGIAGSNVVNFTLSNSTVLNNGNSSGENGIDMAGLTGTAAIDNSTIRGSFEHNFNLLNTAGTLDSLAITDSTFDHLALQSGAAGGNGVLITLQNSAVITDLAIVDSTFRNNFSNGILVNTDGNSRIGADDATSGSTDGAIVAGNSFDDNNIAIQFGVFGSSDITVDIEDNTIVNDERTDTSTAIVLGTSALSAAGSTLNARVEGNVIGDGAIASSGSSFGSGISLVIQGMADVTALIDDNTIREAPYGFGIEVQSHGSNSGTPPASDVTITNNDVDHTNADVPGGEFALPAIWVYADSVGTAGRLNLDLRGNTVPSDPSYFFLGTMIEVYEDGGDIHLVDNPAGPAGQTASEQLQSSNFGTAGAGPGVDLDLTGPLMLPPDLFYP